MQVWFWGVVLVFGFGVFFGHSILPVPGKDYMTLPGWEVLILSVTCDFNY